MRYSRAGFPIPETIAPWGGLGTSIAEAQNSAQAAEIAGLDWTVSTEPAFVVLESDEGGEKFAPVPNSLFTVRDDMPSADIKRVLAPVSGTFEVTQNKDAFSLFDPLSAAGFIEFEAAGSQSGGRLVWMSVWLAESRVMVTMENPVDGFMLLRNSHDAGASLKIMFVPIDLSTNTCVALPIQGVHQHMILRHSKTTQKRVTAADSGLTEMSSLYLASNAELLCVLESTKVSDVVFVRILQSMYPGSRTSRKADLRAIEARSSIQGRFLDAKNRSGYALWHAICAHLDHMRGVTRAVYHTREESRMNAILWGERSLKRAKLGSMLLEALIV